MAELDAILPIVLLRRADPRVLIRPVAPGGSIGLRWMLLSGRGATRRAVPA